MGIRQALAHVVIALHQTVSDGDALVKNKTLPLPFAVLLGDMFQIFQNAALQMKDILKPSCSR